MGDVVPLKAMDNEAVVEALGDAADHLDAAAETLQDDIVAVAMCGVWRAWSDAQPVGTVLMLDDRMISETGDARIELLCDTFRTLRSTVAQLERYRARTASG